MLLSRFVPLTITSLVAVITVQCSPVLDLPESSCGHLVESQPGWAIRDELRQILWSQPDEQWHQARPRSEREKITEADFLQLFINGKQLLKKVFDLQARVIAEAEKLVKSGRPPSMIDWAELGNSAYRQAVKDLTDASFKAEVMQLHDEAKEYTGWLGGHPDPLIVAAKGKFYDDCREAVYWTDGKQLPHQLVPASLEISAMNATRRRAMRQNLESFKDQVDRYIKWYS